MAYDDTTKLSRDKEDDILLEAMERWEICDNHYSDLYVECEEDWQFLHGEGQWDVGAKDSRTKDGRPSLVLNQCLPYAHQITNDIKQARLAIRVVPIDSTADVDTAEIRAGIIRNIEKQSKSKTVYGTAAMNAIGAGIGWIRVKTEYADNDTFEQEAFIERVLDFTSVYLDPEDLTLDGSDADYGFVALTYSHDRFAELYPDDSPVNFEGIAKSENVEDEVNLVEYYYKDFKPNTLYEIEIEGELIQINKDKKKFLDDSETPYELKRERDIEDVVVYHCVLSGDAILSREEFPCHYIPLVPVIGEEFYTNGKREFHSLIRQAKDAQRMYNYWKSASTEMIALQPKSAFIAPVGSFQSYPDKWANANTQNLATLEYDVVNDEATGAPLPPPQRQQPIMGSPAMMQEAVSARDDIRLALGIPQSNMGEKSNAVSGIAIRNQQIEGDNATFHFIDNLSSSIAQVGRILNDIIPALYSERKIARIIGEDGDEENIPVNTPYITDDNGKRAARYEEEHEGVYDLSIGKYDIDMDVGPSYSSKRQETADKLIQAMGIRPELMEVVGDIMFEALDLPMSRQISERIKTQMDPAVLGDDPQAAKLQEAAAAVDQMQEQLNNALAALEDKEKNQQFEQAIKAEEQQLDRDKFQVDAEKTKADIDKIYADIKNVNAETTEQTHANIEHIMERVGDMEGAIGSILDDIEIEVEMVTPEPQEGEMLNEESEQ